MSKQQGNVTHVQGEKKSVNRKWLQVGPDAEFKKGFKVAFMIIFKELKENMVLLSGQIGSLWKL